MNATLLGRARRLALPLAGVAASILAVSLFVGNSTAASRSAGASAAAAAVPAPGTPQSFADVIEKVRAAVVNIEVTKMARATPAALGGPGDGFGPDDRFFGRFFGGPDRDGPAPTRKGAGSGFIIDPAGYIVTNHHVIGGAQHIVVTLASGTKLDAKVVGDDPKTDLALLKVEAPHRLTSVKFGDSDKARIGDWVVAIGDPFGLGGTATAGIISARGRDIQSSPYDDYLQIDAPINPGNSGGPVFDTSGRVLGINTAIYSPNGGNVGIGFAIPSNQARAIVVQLKKSGAVSRAWLGVQIQNLDQSIAGSLGLDNTRGALVSEVLGGGPADTAGVHAGDVIVAFGGKRIGSAKALTRVVGDTPAMSKVSMTVWRDGHERDLSVRLGNAAQRGDRVAGGPRPNGRARDDRRAALGLGLQDLSNGQRQALGLAPGTEGALVAAVAPGSSAESEGIEPGDVIVAVNRERTPSARAALGALRRAARSSRKALLLVRRGDEQHFVVLDAA